MNWKQHWEFDPENMTVFEKDGGGDGVKINDNSICVYFDGKTITLEASISGRSIEVSPLPKNLCWDGTEKLLTKVEIYDCLSNADLALQATEYKVTFLSDHEILTNPAG